MPQKFKEIADDALINVKVNKSYYFMVKNLSYSLYKLLTPEDNILFAELMKNSKNKTNTFPDYNSMNENQKNFYTIILLLAEIENQAISSNLIKDTEILMPEDEGFNPETIKNQLDLPEDLK
jgi:hypothetical protein